MKRMSESVRHVSRLCQPGTHDAANNSRGVCADSSHDATRDLSWSERKLDLAPLAVQETALAELVRADPDLMAILRAARELHLPDCWLTAGAVYQTVWNVLTGMPHRLTAGRSARSA